MLLTMYKSRASKMLYEHDNCLEYLYPGLRYHLDYSFLSSANAR